MTAAFHLDPQLAADTLPLAELPLCRLLLMNDATFPWLILVPRRAGLVEPFELDIADQQQLWLECRQVASALQQACRPYKLNFAAIGNVVRQLHLHLIARQPDDPCWPKPVWSNHRPQPLAADLALAQPWLQQLLAQLGQGAMGKEEPQ